MLADERGRRSFSFSDAEHALPRAASPASRAASPSAISMRWVLDDVATAEAALAATAARRSRPALGLRAHGIVTRDIRAAAAPRVDVFASREHARGGMARRGPRLVLATDRGIASSAAVAPLSPGAVLGVLSLGRRPDAARRPRARSCASVACARLPLALRRRRRGRAAPSPRRAPAPPSRSARERRRRRSTGAHVARAVARAPDRARRHRPRACGRARAPRVRGDARGARLGRPRRGAATAWRSAAPAPVS